MRGFRNDVRYTVRLWMRHPGFTAVAVLTLALGIGANTTMYSVVNATLLAPLPYPEPERLVSLWKGRIDAPDQLNIVSLQDYRYWLERARMAQTLALLDSAGRGYNLTGPGQAEQVSGVRVTASFFDVLDVPPLLGRTFRDEEEQPGRDDVVVLSHGLWVRRYGADPALVGRAILVDGQPRTVVGVMPPQFRFQFFSGLRELWVPAGWTRGDLAGGSNSFMAIGRLARRATFEQFRSEMDAIGPAEAAEGQEYASWAARAVPLSDVGMRDLRRTLLAILGVVGFVLLIACVNVANLMLSRAAARQREMAIRSAIGAGRGRLVRQLMTESVLLGLLGGSAGLLLALWGTSILLPVLPASIRFMPLRPIERIEVDAVVLAFTAGVSVLSGVLFGLAPALAAFRADLSRTIKESGRGSAGGRSRLRHALVASEVALTLVTLAGAGVLIASMVRLLGVDPGLDARNVLVMSMSLPQEDLFYGPPGNLQFCRQLDERVGSQPGVVSVSAIAHLPLSGAAAGRSYAVEGRPDPGAGNAPGATYSVACPGLLRTLGIGLVAGRDFTHQDTVGAPAVALVNKRMASQAWPDRDAIGQRFKLGRVDDQGPWLTVVGVFEDIRHFGLASEPPPLFYRPYSQAGWPGMSIVTRTASAPEAFVAPVRESLVPSRGGTVAGGRGGRRERLVGVPGEGIGLILGAMVTAVIVRNSVGRETLARGNA